MFTDKERITAPAPAGQRRTAVSCAIQLGRGSDPIAAASSTPGNSLFTKALPLCAFGVVTLRFDFLLFKEVCYCHQGLYLITERHQREMKHSGESLEGAFWRKLASSLGWVWLLKFPLSFVGHVFFVFFFPLPFWESSRLISFVPYHWVRGRIRVVAETFQHDVAVAYYAVWNHAVFDCDVDVERNSQCSAGWKWGNYSRVENNPYTSEDEGVMTKRDSVS